MALYKWPTDPPGKPASHKKTYDQHVNDEKIKASGKTQVGATGQQIGTGIPNFPGYSVDQINVLNGLIPGGTGVQGVPGVVTEPPVQQQPFDPALEIAKLQATQNIQIGDADSAWNKGQLMRSSGIDQAGNVITAGDSFSPFSQAMQLQDAYKASTMGTQNSYASQGQYNSGAYGRAQNRNGLNYAKGFDELKTGALQGYHGIGREQLGTYASNSQGVAGQDFNSLLKSVYGG